MTNPAPAEEFPRRRVRSFNFGSILVHAVGTPAAGRWLTEAMRRRIRFPPFHLDLVDERLWRGAEVVRLRPRTFAVLRYLVQRPNRLVTKAELLQAVWPDTRVSSVVLKVCVRELRAALDDSARAPQFIETVHGRGYRFVGRRRAMRPTRVALDHSLQARG